MVHGLIDSKALLIDIFFEKREIVTAKKIIVQRCNIKSLLER
jgi:hypothetical protein